MRPRFSLRWLLIVLAVFAVALYVFFVQPTIRSYQLVSIAKEGVFQPSSNVFTDLQGIWTSRNAQLQPRTWKDLLKFRRRVIVLAKLDVGSGLIYDVGLTYSIGPFDSQIIQKDVGRSNF
jgi:hypothetical protein